jgi:asparagine synthase (glutamine-hydrolysing)
MCDIQAHRGPDDAGYALFSPSGDRPDGALSAASYHDPLFRRAPKTRVFDSKAANSPSCLLALGHRRLSILDLSSLGHQPMESSEGGLWTVYNGELYNYPELKASLQAAGRKFKTGSDTEALLELWRIKGRGALELFDGMFALAMYDSRANKLFLARDRFGVKPLYYALSSDGQFLLFASEIKGILASGLLKPEIDPSGVAEYFTFQNQFGEQTLFKGVSRLMPCETLEVSPGRGEISRSRYFKHNFSMDFSADSGERTSMTLTSLFEAAVSRQLISDVDVGSYLSGGMDSGSIVAVAGRKIPRVLTFTGGFDLTNVSGIELSFDERRMAERLSYLLQTEHYDVVLHAGDMPAVMERLTWLNDDLRVGMCHQNWYVAKLASRFVKVCLAGAGGDELFGGYPWRYELALRAKDLASFDDGLFKFWHRALPCDELPRVFSPAVSGFEGVARARFEAALSGAPAWEPSASKEENLLQRAMFFEFNTFLQGFLSVEDRLSMAHGMESRVPFLDNALAAFALRLPPRLKMNIETQGAAPSGKARGFGGADGKLILRKAMGKLLPKEFLKQRKQGFSPPDENWYRGPSMDYIKSILYDERTLARPWFDQAFVKEKLDEHFSGVRNHRLLMWSLMSFEWIQRHFVDGRQVANFKPGMAHGRELR